MYQKLQKEQLQARKEGNKLKASLLSTILSETQKKSKEKNQSSSIEELALNVVQKLLKTTEENLSLNLIEKQKESLNVEAEILKSYLPRQLSENEILKIVESLENKTARTVMPYFKQNYAGQYSPKQLNTLLSKFN